MKGSYYVNCDFYQNAKHEACFKNARKEYSAETISNIWPPENTLPGFRGIFEELCWIIIDTAALVARACDRYALANIEGYEEGYLERVVRTSRTTKARLLHYFPSSEDAVSSDEERRLLDENPIEEDNWCATHIDHGCLTGLTSALYIDESAHPPVVPTDLKLPSLPILPALPSAPSPTTGLYIKSRTSKITRVDIPPLCLAFVGLSEHEIPNSVRLTPIPTIANGGGIAADCRFFRSSIPNLEVSECVQTGGKFRAVPHFVRAGNNSNIARNTLAVFTQPNLEEIVDNKRGLTFADFSKEVNERFG